MERHHIRRSIDRDAVCIGGGFPHGIAIVSCLFKRQAAEVDLAGGRIGARGFQSGRIHLLPVVTIRCHREAELSVCEGLLDTLAVNKRLLTFQRSSRAGVSGRIEELDRRGDDFGLHVPGGSGGESAQRVRIDFGLFAVLGFHDREQAPRIGHLIAFQTVLVDLQDGIAVDRVSGHCNFKQILRIIQRHIGLRGRRILRHQEIVGASLCEMNVFKQDRAVFVLCVALKHFPERLVRFIGFDRFLQLLQYEVEFLSVRRDCVVEQLARFDIGIEADERSLLIGPQMAFCGRLNFVADQAAVEVAAGPDDKINIGLRGHNMSQKSAVILRQFDLGRIREIPKDRHAGSVFHISLNFFGILTVDGQLRRINGSRGPVRHDRGRDFGQVFSRYRQIRDNVDGHTDPIGPVDNDIRTGRDINDHAVFGDLDIQDLPGFRDRTGRAQDRSLEPVPVDVVVRCHNIAASVRFFIGIAFIGMSAVYGLAEDGVDRADVGIPVLFIVAAAVDPGAALYRYIAADNRRRIDHRAVGHTVITHLDHIPPDQKRPHEVLLQQEVAVSVGALSAVAGAGHIVGAKRDDIIVVQDVLQRIAVELIRALRQTDRIIDVGHIFVLPWCLDPFGFNIGCRIGFHLEVIHILSRFEDQISVTIRRRKRVGFG